MINYFVLFQISQNYKIVSSGVYGCGWINIILLFFLIRYYNYMYINIIYIYIVIRNLNKNIFYVEWKLKWQ